MSDLIVKILGEYQPLVGNTGPLPSVAGLDWPWIIGAAAFLICLFSCFRLLGVLLKYLLS